MTCPRGKSGTETVFRTYAITYGDIYVEASTIYGAEDLELYDISLVKVGKAGFFRKLIAFFKKIFGMTKVIPEAFKGIF